MAKADEVFRPALEEKEIPILTLDNKWHRLFTQAQHTAEIKATEEKLNRLIRRQGKLNTESKDIRKLKKKLMEEIVILADEMDDHSTKRQEKDMADHKRLVSDCSAKLEAYEKELRELPEKIKQVNNRLMLITMEECYDRLQKNAAEIDEIENWVTEIRKELKKRMVRKQEKERMNYQLYSYMHDIFGADVMEMFDLKYDPEERFRKEQEASENTDSQ